MKDCDSGTYSALGEQVSFTGLFKKERLDLQVAHARMKMLCLPLGSVVSFFVPLPRKII